MEHPYLNCPGRWRAEGTYYDGEGRPLPLTGRSELIWENGARRLEGWMEAADSPPARFTNCYIIHETPLPFTLSWQSHNPALGVLEGTFELVGTSILSRYASADQAYSGWEILTLQEDGLYYNAGVAMAHGRRMSAWTAILTQEKEPT